MKGIKVRLSAQAWSDHYTRLYLNEYALVDGKRVTVFPAPHCDDVNAFIISIKEGKRLVTVVLTEAAVTEMLSDFDFYSEMSSSCGEYADMANVVRAMRAAATSIRKQITKEAK